MAMFLKIREMTREERDGMYASVRKEMESSYRDCISRLESQVEDLMVYKKIYEKLTITTVITKEEQS